MSKPKKPLTKTESAIQLGNVLKFGTGGGGTLKSIFKTSARVLKRALKIKSKPTSSATKVKEVQTKPKKSLQNQKPDTSAKSSDWDAKLYNQPTGHGKPMGPRAARDLTKKHLEAAMNKRIKAGTITQGGTKIRNTGNKSNPEASSPHYKLRLYKKDGSWNKEHV